MSRLLYRTLRVLAITLLLSSCGELLLPPLEIRSTNVAEGYNDPGSLRNITVTFDRAPSPPSIYKSFTLTQDGNAMGGEFIISGSTVVFVPTEGFSPGHQYFLRITTAAEDEKGLSIPRDYTVKFTTKTEEIRPEVLGITPADESIIDDCPWIRITFSEAVDPISFIEQFSLQPSLKTRTEWDGLSQVATLIPLESLERGTKYTVTIGEALRDTAGNTLGTSHKTSFTFGTDTTAPDYTLVWIDRDDVEHPLTPGVNNPQVQTGGKILLRFTEAVQMDNLSGYIQAIPDRSISVKTDLETKKEATINFGTAPEWGSTVTLRVMEGIEDTAGNKMKEVREYPLEFSAESSRPPKVQEARLCVDPTNPSDLKYQRVSQDTAFNTLTLDALIFPKNSAKATHMDVFFQVSADATALDLVSLMESLAISGTNGCASFTITSIDMSVSIDPISYPAVSQGKVIAVRIGLDIENGENQGLIWFKMPKGLKDSLGNGSEADWTIPLCKA